MKGLIRLSGDYDWPFESGYLSLKDARGSVVVESLGGDVSFRFGIVLGIV